MNNNENNEFEYYEDFSMENELPNKQKGKPYIKILFAIILSLIIICGSSYAFYTLTIKSDKNMELVAGTLKINFNEGNAIKLNNVVPMSDNEGIANDENSYTFEITNTGNLNSKYNLYLEEININKNALDKKYIKYSLKENDGEWSSPELLSNGLIIRSNRLLNVDENVKYELKMWLTEEADNSVYGKSFSAKIVVDTVQSNIVAEDRVVPVINISNTSISISQNDSFIEPVPYEIKDNADRTIDSSKVTKTYEYYDGENTTIVDHIDTSKIGIYYIYYRVTDQLGNTGCTVVSVCINNSADNKPKINLLGEDHIEIKKGENYEEAGATAHDIEDGILNDKIVTIGTVNTLVEGEYPIKYITIDSNGNTASVSRVVNVIHKGDIAITINDIKRKNGRYQFLANIETINGNIVGYYLSNQSNPPDSINYTKLDTPTNNYSHAFSVPKSGVYYLYAYDTNNNVKSKEIVINPGEDATRPNCIFSNEEYIGIGTTTIDLICTDEMDIVDHNISKNNFDINNSDIAEITRVSTANKIDNGYQYTIELNGIKPGSFNIKLNKDSVTNADGYSNEAVEKNMQVQELTSNIDNNELDIEVEETKNLTIENNVGKLTYTSSNPDIASVDEQGNVTGVAIGTTIVTVTDSTTNVSIKIKVNVYKTVRINWISNGATLNSSISSCRITGENSSCKITSPSIEREGYNIIGFNRNSNDTTSIWNANEEKEVFESATYYAITKKDITIKVYYSNNGSVLTHSSNHAVYNENGINYEATDEIKNSIGLEGLTYKGLSQTVNSIDASKQYANIKNDTTYYAVYHGNMDIKFYYYKNNNQEIETISREVNSILTNEDDNNYSINEDEEINVPAEVLASTGIDDSKYYGLSTNVSSKSISDKITTKNSKYYTIYKGTWTINYTQDSSSIAEIGQDRDSCDNYSTTDGNIYHIEGDNCTTTLPNIIEKEHYSEGKWYFQDQVVGNKDTPYEITGNKAFTARAIPNIYTVSYNCSENEGICEMADETVTYGDKADITKEAVLKIGYNFLGWNTDKDATDGLVDAPIVTSDMTLYAIFKKATDVSLERKTATYTGSEISPAEANIENGPVNPQVTYQFYNDEECKTAPINTPIDAGKYYVQATVAKSGRYNEAKSNCAMHVILPKTLNINWNVGETFIYNKKEQAPQYQIEDQIEGEELELVQTKEIDAGNYTTKVSLLSVIGGRGKIENYELQNNTYDYAINPAEGYIVLSSESREVEQGTDTDIFNIIDTHGGELSVTKTSNDDAEVNLNDRTVTISNLSDMAIGTVITLRITCLATNNYYMATTDYKITIKKPEVNPNDAVARINQDYYTSLEEALNNAQDSGDTIVMLKDTTESVENIKDVTIDLNGKTITGLNDSTIINNGTLTIVNAGFIINTTDTAIVNNNTLTLGQNDGDVSKDEPRIEGTNSGIKQQGTMNFYDGVITAYIGIIGGYVTDKPEGYIVFIDHDYSNGYQKVYLEDESSALTRAVAQTFDYTNQLENGTYPRNLYFDLQDAINTVTTTTIDKNDKRNITIYAIRDFEAAYKLDLEANNEVIIDITGHTVETGNDITNNGDLTLMDSSAIKGILKPSMTITNNNELTLEGITISQTTNRNVITSSGNLNMASSSINATSGYGVELKSGTINTNNDSSIVSTSNYALYITSSDKVTLNGGHYQTTNSYSAIYISNKSTLEANDIHITGYRAIINNGTATINNAEVEVKSYGISNTGNIVIEDGNYTSTGESIVSNGGTMSILSGTYITNGGSSNNNTVSNSGVLNIGDPNNETKYPTIIATGDSRNALYINNYQQTPTVNIYNGEITGGYDGILMHSNNNNYLATMNIYNGRIIGNRGKGLDVYKTTLNIYGGYIKGKTYGIGTSTTTNLILGNNSDAVSTTTPEIIGEQYGLYIGGGTTSFYDGILKGKTKGYSGSITNLPHKYGVEENEEIIEEETYKTAYLVKALDFLKVGDNTYNTFEDALTDISDTGIIEVIESTSISEQVLIPNEMDITLDLGGKKLINSKSITNEGKLKIIDSSSDETGTYINTSIITSEYAIKSINDLTITSGTIKATSGANAIYISGKGNITGGNYYAYGTSSNNVLYIATNMDITGGTFTSDWGCIAIKVAADNNINVQNIEINGRYGINGNVNIENSTINTTSQAIESNNATIKSGVYTSIKLNGDATIGDKDDDTKKPTTGVIDVLRGTINIYNGEISGISSNWYNPVINIYDGIIGNSTSVSRPITISNTTLNMYGGTVISLTEVGIYLGDKTNANIYSGKIIGKTYGIWANNYRNGYTGKLIIGNIENNIDKTTPEIIGEQYGLMVTENRDVSFYNGILKGKTNGYSGTITSLPEGYEIETGEETIDESIYKTAYLGEIAGFLKVGDKKYSTFKKAIEAIEEEGTIEVLESASISEQALIPNEKNITLDLAGKQLTNTKMITNEGKLKVIDSSPEETGVYINTSIVNSEYAIKSTNDLTLESGSIKTTGEASTIYISGKGNITGGTYSMSPNTSTHRVLYIATDMDITGGTFSVNTTAYSSYGMEIAEGKTVNISGVEINGTGIGIEVKKDVNLSVEDSSITGTGGIRASNTADLTIKSGTYNTITCYGNAVIGDPEDPTKIPVINGTGYDAGVKVSSGTTNIYNGNISGYDGISNNGSTTVNIYQATINGTNRWGIEANGNLNLYNGTVTGKTYGIKTNTATNLVLGNNEDGVNTTTPQIIGEQYGLYINGGTIAFYDGILKGKTAGYYGTITEVADNYNISDEVETIDGSNYQINYLTVAEDFIQNGETKYNSLKTAVLEAQDGDTLTVIKDSRVLETVNTAADKNVTLDLNSHNLNFNKAIVNNGTLAIIDSGDNGKLSTNVSSIIISNNGHLSLGDITLENFTTNYYLINNQNGSSMDANNTSFTGYAGIYNSAGANLVADHINLDVKSSGIYNYSNCKISNSTLTRELNSDSNTNNAYLFFNNTSGDYEVVLENNNYNSLFSSSSSHHIHNSNGTLNIKGGEVNTYITNSAELNLLNTNIITQYESTAVNNMGSNLNIDGGSISIERNSTTTAINSQLGNTTIKNMDINLTSTASTNTATAINIVNNKQNIQIENVNIDMNNYAMSYGIYAQSASDTTIKNTNINLIGNTNVYGTNITTRGINVTNSNANVTFENGTINTNGINAYGIYVENGTVILGEMDGSGTKNASVSIENPFIKAIGTTTGIGVKKVNGLFKYYDGKIIGSTNAKPETTTEVETKYEARFYIDEETGYEYCILEFME